MQNSQTCYRKSKTQIYGELLGPKKYKHKVCSLLDKALPNSYFINIDPMVISQGVWPHFVVWSPLWLYASSVKNKTKIIVTSERVRSIVNCK